MSRPSSRGLPCVRVHRARRALRSAAIVAALVGGARAARAQVPTYPTYPTYPSYPTVPAPPAYPGYPTLPTTPGAPPTPAAPVLATYRLPVITIAQPVEGVVLPDDKPVAVLRFAAAEPLDPIDALSLSVTVDGTDRTALFTLTQGEAWGRLSPIDQPLGAGQHEVRARICSARGTCGTAKGTVTVIASASLLERLGASGASTQASQGGSSRTTKVLGAVLQAVRVLIR